MISERYCRCSGRSCLTEQRLPADQALYTTYGSVRRIDWVPRSLQRQIERSTGRRSPCTWAPVTRVAVSVPSSLTRRLTPCRDRFSSLFAQLVTAALLDRRSPRRATPVPGSLGSSDLCRRVLSLLVDRPASRRVVNFGISRTSRDHLRALLRGGHRATLAPTRATRLSLCRRLSALVNLLGIQTCATLGSAPRR